MNHYNQHILPMRNSFVYSWKHENPYFGIRQTLEKHFLHPAGGGSTFPAKSCQDTWRSGHRLARGQVKMVDECPIHSTLEALVLWRVVGHCRTRIGPFLLTSASCRRCNFQCISSVCWAYFSDVMFSPGFRKLWWIRQATDHYTVTMTFLFWYKFVFGYKFEEAWIFFSVQTLSWSLPVVT